MNVPVWAFIFLYVLIGIISFCLILVGVLNIWLIFLNEMNPSERRVLPIERIRREHAVIEMVERINKYKQDQVVEQIKNSVLLINPNETIQIGLPKKKP